jgi:hypothetical protein
MNETAQASFSRRKTLYQKIAVSARKRMPFHGSQSLPSPQTNNPF